MKRLFIIRHAKSSWKDVTLDDFDRPLNKRGKKDAPFMAKLLKDKKINPDLILSSPAERAKTTANIIAKELDLVDRLIFRDTIYESSLSTLINYIKKADDKNKTIFIVGHNPSLNALAYEFIDFDENIPTCGIVEIRFDIENWKDINENNANLISFEYPKKYKNKED